MKKYAIFTQALTGYNPSELFAPALFEITGETEKMYYVTQVKGDCGLVPANGRLDKKNFIRDFNSIDEYSEYEKLNQDFYKEYTTAMEEFRLRKTEFINRFK